MHLKIMGWAVEMGVGSMFGGVVCSRIVLGLRAPVQSSRREAEPGSSRVNY